MEGEEFVITFSKIVTIAKNKSFFDKFIEMVDIILLNKLLDNGKLSSNTRAFIQ